MGESSSVESRVVSASAPIFAIFEGGGAKGISHVGAYAAADEQGFEFVGVAGASAGSIIAALIAVGFSPDEIFDPRAGGRDIFTDNDLTPIGVLGAARWKLFQSMKKCWRPVLMGEAALLLASLVAEISGYSVPARLLACVCLVTGGCLAVLVRTLLKSRGFLEPAHFARIFNAILYHRVKAVHARDGKDVASIPDKIRFRDIDPQQSGRFCRLKVVATDVTGQQLKLFDHRTPDAVVAEVVAASIAIPGVFKPAQIPSARHFGAQLAGEAVPEHDYADGGLVSNLPVWCFAEEKAAIERRTPHNAPVPVVAFTLTDPDIRTDADKPADTASAVPQAPARPLAYFARVLLTGIFGGQTVIQEFVNDLYAIQLQSPLGLLAFDADRATAIEAFKAGKDQAAMHLHQRLVLVPQAWHETLEATCAEVLRILLSELAAETASRVHLRAAVFEPILPSRGPSSTFITAYRATHSYNMQNDADDRLTLDAACPGVPEAFEQRSVTLLPPERGRLRRSVMTKYERALVRRTMISAICVPIFADPADWSLAAELRGQPLAVVSFDSDADIVSGLQSPDGLQMHELVLKSIAEATFPLSDLLAGRPKDFSNER